MKGIFGKLVLCAAMLLAAVGCGGGGGPVQAPDPTVRFVNVAPDSTSLEYLLNDTVKATGLAYLALSPAFISVKPDNYDLIVREVGAAAPLDAATVSLASNQHFVSATVGLENFGTENLKRAQLVGITVDLTVPNANKAKLIVLHGYIRAPGFDTPAIDFQKDPGDNPQIKLTNIAFATTSSVVVDSGPSQFFEAKRTGTVDVLASATQSLDSGGIYLVLVTGVEGQIGAQAPQLLFLKLN